MEEGIVIFVIVVILFIVYYKGITSYLVSKGPSTEELWEQLLEQARLETPEPNVDIENVYEDGLEAKLTEDYLTLDNYIGQESSIKYLKGHLKIAKEKDKPLLHTVLWGSGGLGKSTLMKAVAHHMGGRFIELVPANLRDTKELFNRFFRKICQCGFVSPFSSNKCLGCRQPISEYFTPEIQLQDGDIIFLEECHGLKESIEEAMYSLLQDGYMQLRFNGIDQRVPFPKITIAGATTRLGSLNKPFRDRFKLSIKLEPYKVDEIKKITKMYGEHNGLTFDDKALELIANISNGVPRIAKKFVDDAATIANHITEKELKQILTLLRIDNSGLDADHHKVMSYILTRMKAVKNGGAGSNAIASAIAIPKAVYEEVYEPALLYQELIFQGSKGRQLTEKALKKFFPNDIKDIKK
jgi:Holliday junction DNA helicase RuvB